MIRTYSSVRALLDASDLPPDALHLAHRIFRRYAEAEARVQRRDIETVTFHELAGLDAIVDVAGTALGLTMLGVERVFSSAVPTGLGMARSEHGAMPIPSATVVELLRGAPVFSRGVSAELTTATGAAILAATVEGYGEIPALRIEEAGYGAGSARLDFPNVTRVLVGMEEPASSLPSVPGVPELRLVPEPREPDDPGGRLTLGSLRRARPSYVADNTLRVRGAQDATVIGCCAQSVFFGGRLGGTEVARGPVASWRPLH